MQYTGMNGVNRKMKEEEWSEKLEEIKKMIENNEGKRIETVNNLHKELKDERDKKIRELNKIQRQTNTLNDIIMFRLA